MPATSYGKKAKSVASEEKEIATATTTPEETVTVSKKEFEDMKAQMAALMQMMAMGGMGQPKEKKPERQIPFVNMTQGKYILKGSSYYVIDRQFESRSFVEREARLIVSNMEKDIKAGRLYIPDAEFVKDCDLDWVYEGLISDKDMVDLLNREPKYVVEVYKSATEGQKKIIEDMIETKRLNAQQVDANILMQIGELCGRDLLNIAPMEEDTKEG